MTQDAKEFAREIYFDDDGRGGTSLERIAALITARDGARDAELVERIIGEIVEWWGGSYPMVERIIRDAARRTK